MNVLEKILEEIEERLNMVESIPVNEDDDFLDGEECYEDGRTQGRFKELLWCRDIIRSHMDEARDTNVPSNDEIEPVSEEFLKDCAETAARYKRNFGNWISVEERLPEKTDYYLVQLSRKLPNEDYSDRVVVLFNGEEKEFECYANLIIAWQPLPERYKGGDSNA